MTNSLCVVCKTNPQEFRIVDSVLVCCVDCNYKEENMEIKLYRLIDEGVECSVGTEAEVIKYHNDWVENNGIFEAEEIADALATTIDDLEEHWTVEQFYTVVLKVEE